MLSMRRGGCGVDLVVSWGYGVAAGCFATPVFLATVWRPRNPKTGFCAWPARSLGTSLSRSIGQITSVSMVTVYHPPARLSKYWVMTDGWPIARDAAGRGRIQVDAAGGVAGCGLSRIHFTTAMAEKDPIDSNVRLEDADAALEFLKHEGEGGVVSFSEEDEKRLVRKIDWRIVPLMWSCYFLQYLDKTLSMLSSPPLPSRIAIANGGSSQLCGCDEPKERYEYVEHPVLLPGYGFLHVRTLVGGLVNRKTDI